MSRFSDETADLLESRRAFARGDMARVREIDERRGMIQFAPGRFVNRSVLGTPGYEAETRAVERYASERRFEDLAEDEQVESLLERAIALLEVEAAR